MKRVRTLILGGGLAGLSTAYHLGKDFLLVERERELGGLARSRRVEGFTCDLTGHLLHCRTEYGRRLVEELLGENLHWFPRRSAIWFQGRLVRYPFQAYLCDLPEAVRKECLEGFREAQRTQAAGPPLGAADFEEWVRARFGEGIARHFMLPYNRKVWAEPLSALDVDWTENRVPVPTLAEVEAGAEGKLAKEFGYNVSVGYPKVGGIQALTDGLLARVDAGTVRTGVAVESLDLVARRARLSGGEEVEFERCVSTVPLPVLARITRHATSEVQQAAEGLRSNVVVCLSVSSPVPLPCHWVYVPGPEAPFYRVGCSSLFSSAVAPPGRHLLYVELAYASGAEARVPEGEVMSSLGRMMGADSESFRVVDTVALTWAYPLFTKGWKSRVSLVRHWFSSRGVRAVGRFGRWAWHSMEDAILDGREAAETGTSPQG